MYDATEMRQNKKGGTARTRGGGGGAHVLGWGTIRKFGFRGIARTYGGLCPRRTDERRVGCEGGGVTWVKGRKAEPGRKKQQ